MIAVGKTVPYGIVLLARPCRTVLVLSNQEGEEYIPVDVAPQLAATINHDDRYLEKCRIHREFEQHVRAYLRQMEEFFDERPARPLADGH